MGCEARLLWRLRCGVVAAPAALVLHFTLRTLAPQSALLFFFFFYFFFFFFLFFFSPFFHDFCVWIERQARFPKTVLSFSR